MNRSNRNCGKKKKKKSEMRRIVIRTRLYLIRIWRILKIMCPKMDIILYLLLILLWLAFGLVTKNILFVHDGKSVTYLRTIWNLRNSIFTSIVLAFAIGAFNHLREYRKTLKRQHFLYVDSMADMIVNLKLSHALI